MKLFVFLLVILTCASTSTAQTLSNEKTIIGLWGATKSFGPSLRGQFRLIREKKDWKATIAGTVGLVKVAHDRVTVTTPDSDGHFAGYFTSGNRSIRGHWIQPKGIATGVEWATPVELIRSGNTSFVGTIVPLEEAVTIYMDVRAESDGTLVAVLRNPDGRWQSARVKLMLAGSAFKLISLNDSVVLNEGDYDRQKDVLRLREPNLGTIFELRRQSHDQATGFYPRTSGARHYKYHQPTTEDDGWRTASLTDEGFSEEKISSFLQTIIDTDPGKPAAPLIHSLLIARHGKLVLEEYFYGFDKESRHDMRSGGKTFASVLSGIAIDRGAHFNALSRVYSLFPNYKTFANPDPRKQEMTVEHLMTMTSGFDCDENSDGDKPGNEGNMQSQTTQPDWYKFMLDTPLANAPGDSFAYCSGAVNLIGGIIHDTTHVWLPEFFDRYYAQPLQIKRYHFNLTPTGEGYLGGGIHIRPRDELKLGQLFLDGGVWNGKRVVSRSWVETSIAPHPMKAHGRDGYNWHLNEIKMGQHVFREYEANGNGGQLMMVIPELDMAVMFTAGNYGNYGVWRRFREEFLPQYIIAAVSSKPSDK